MWLHKSEFQNRREVKRAKILAISAPDQSFWGIFLPLAAVSRRQRKTSFTCRQGTGWSLKHPASQSHR